VSLNAWERETVITFNDGEPHAVVTTWQPSIVTKLSRNPAAERIEDLQFDKLAGATFRIPKDLISFRTGKRELSPERRAALAEQGRRSLAARSNSRVTMQESGAAAA